MRSRALVAMVLAGPLVSSAQVPVFTSTTNLVVLSATAVDSRGRPVRDLQANELRIYDAGQPQALLRFSRGRDSGARLMLLVDASGSMSQELRSASVRMAVLQLLAALSPDDEVAVAGFDEGYRRLQGFSVDRSAVSAALDAITPFGSTALHDALQQASEEMASAVDGRRAIVVITDGIDTASRHGPDDVIAGARASDVPIYPISIVSPLDDPASRFFTKPDASSATNLGRTALRRYAETSGGVAFTVSEFRELKAAVEQIASELSFQYRLGYEPPAGPAGFRQVEVRTTRKGVAVRSRRGYVPLS